MPVSPTQRNSYADDLIDQVAALALYGGTPVPLGHGTYMSDASDYFQSQVFDKYRKGQEAKAKLSTAMFSRLDSIIKGIGNVISGLSKR